jgi:hypothetical protein
MASGEGRAQGGVWGPAGQHMACGARRQRVALTVDGGAWRREAVAHGGRGCQRVVRSDRVSESKRDVGRGTRLFEHF